MITTDGATVAFAEWSVLEYGQSCFQRIYRAVEFAAECINPGGHVLEFLLPARIIKKGKKGMFVLPDQPHHLTTKEWLRVNAVLLQLIVSRHPTTSPLKTTTRMSCELRRHVRLAIRAYHSVATILHESTTNNTSRWREQVDEEVRLRFDSVDIASMKRLALTIDTYRP